MGRRERPLDPGAGAVSAFACGLRELRRAAGSPSYRKMARLAHYSDTVLSVSASGDAMPSLAVTLGYVRACGGDEAQWERRWTDTVRQVERAAEAERSRTVDGAGASGWTAVRARPGAELAGGTADFAGRCAELAALSQLAAFGSRTGPGPDRARILLVTGAPGVGKTTMVLHWAQTVADSFSDGQLHVNLRGHDPSGQPVDPGQAIRELLEALGVAASRLPASRESQVGLYRTMLSGKRILLVLDNARDARQVRPLLPGAQGCLTVVTGRDQLASLVAAEGARPLQLGPLTEPDALELLALRLGKERVAAEPEAAHRVVTLCARLPLTLSAVAARAATRPALSLASLAADLADPQTCLELPPPSVTFVGQP